MCWKKSVWKLTPQIYWHHQNAHPVITQSPKTDKCLGKKFFYPFFFLKLSDLSIFLVKQRGRKRKKKFLLTGNYVPLAHDDDHCNQSLKVADNYWIVAALFLQFLLYAALCSKGIFVKICLLHIYWTFLNSEAFFSFWIDETFCTSQTHHFEYLIFFFLKNLVLLLSCNFFLFLWRGKKKRF